jgi:hypothetical protein
MPKGYNGKLNDGTLWYMLPLDRGDIVRDEQGVYGRAVGACSCCHRAGKLTHWTVKVEYRRGDRWLGFGRILGPEELSVWRDGEWQELRIK